MGLRARLRNLFGERRAEQPRRIDDLTAAEAKALWILVDMVIDRPPPMVARIPELRMAARTGWAKLYRIYRGMPIREVA